MKICFIITSFSSGGAEHQLQELANCLVDYGYEIEITTFADLPDHYKLDKRIIRKRIAPHKNKFRKLFGLWKHILQNDASIFFTFGQRESILSVPAFLFNHKHLYVGERNSDLRGFSKLKYYILFLVYKRANCIIPNSQTQGLIITTAFPSLSSKIHIITNYTDINKYLNNYPQERNVIQICIFARYSEQKNYRRFAKALQEIKKECSIPFHVDWFGNKSVNNTRVKSEHTHFNDLINQFDINDIITLNDAITNVSSKMREYDAFCLPSIFEGFSNSISEAICSGLPALVSDVSDNSVMVKDGINGFLFDPLDVESIKNSFIRFLHLSYDERKKMSNNSRRLAETLFDKKVFIKKYISLFHLK